MSSVSGRVVGLEQRPALGGSERVISGLGGQQARPILLVERRAHLGQIGRELEGRAQTSTARLRPARGWSTIAR